MTGEDEITRADIDQFMIVVLAATGGDVERAGQVLDAAHRLFRTDLPLCEARYRATELSHPPVCHRPYRHSGLHDAMPGWPYADRWR